jgi:hypothetical protein
MTRRTTSQESGALDIAKAGYAYTYRPWLHGFHFKRFKPRYMVLQGSLLRACKKEHNVCVFARAINVQARDPA